MFRPNRGVGGKFGRKGGFDFDEKREDSSN